MGQLGTNLPSGHFYPMWTRDSYQNVGPVRITCNYAEYISGSYPQSRGNTAFIAAGDVLYAR